MFLVVANRDRVGSTWTSVRGGDATRAVRFGLGQILGARTAKLVLRRTEFVPRARGDSRLRLD